MKLNEPLEDILSRKEELCDELKAHLENNGTFDLIRHPLVYSVPHYEAKNALVNKQLEYRKKEAKELLEKKDYFSFVFIHEKPHRMNAFIEVKNNLSDKEYWEMALAVWTNSDNIWQNRDTWKKLLKDKKRIDTKHLFMSEDDRKVFDKLPETITVYRGYHENRNEFGYSYTLNESIAKRFSKGHKLVGKVYIRTVNKSEVFAYTNERNEQEVIII